MDFRVGSSPISRIVESLVLQGFFAIQKNFENAGICTNPILPSKKQNRGITMAKNGYYTSGEFARKANVTLVQ